MVRERFTIDFTAIDRVSRVADGILNKIRKLSRAIKPIRADVRLQDNYTQTANKVAKEHRKLLNTLRRGVQTAVSGIRPKPIITKIFFKGDVKEYNKTMRRIRKEIDRALGRHKVTTISVSMRDNVSTVIRKIEQRLESLGIRSSKTGLQVARTAYRIGIPFQSLPNMIGTSTETIIRRLFAVRKQLENEINKMEKALRKLEKERDYPAITRLKRELQTLHNLYRYVDNAYRTYTANVARSMIERQQISRVNRMKKGLDVLSKTFRKAATDMVWGTLSILGVVWSLEGFIGRLTAPMQSVIAQMTDFGNAATNLAKFLYFAEKANLDFVKSLPKEKRYKIETIDNRIIVVDDEQLKKLQKEGKVKRIIEVETRVDKKRMINDLKDLWMTLQATFGNIQGAILLFVSRIFSGVEGEKLLTSIRQVFSELMMFLTDPKTIEATRQFINSFIEGMREGIKTLEYFRDNFGYLAPVIGKFGGKLLVLLPILAPVLTALQAIGAIAQALTFTGGVLAKVVKIVGNAFLFAWNKIGQLARLLPVVGNVIRTLAAARFPALIAVISKLRGVLTILFTLIRAHPIGILITVLGLVVMWVYKVTDGFKNWNNLLEALKAPLNWLYDKLQGIWKALQPVASALGGVASLLGLNLGGEVRQNVNINQYVSVGQITETVDAKKVVDILVEDMVYRLG